MVAFQMLVMLNEASNSTVQPLSAALPAPTAIEAVKPEPQLLTMS